MTKRYYAGSKSVLWPLTILIIGGLTAGASIASETTKYSEMVTVPAGKFIFGKRFSKKEINLPAFSIDKFEVTNERYAKVVKDHKYPPEWIHYPVVQINHFGAEAYCEAVGKRLPTVQEWEKAARGSDGRTYPWGKKFDKTAAVTSETAVNAQPSVVGSRENGKSPYGVMDMAGNVWEWTASFDGRYLILKGGSYYEGKGYSKTTGSLTSIPDDSKEYVGFRCANDGK
jgi:iron(II)-dependent oxidoreductase